MAAACVAPAFIGSVVVPLSQVSSMHPPSVEHTFYYFRRIAHAPYHVLSRMGVKGPKPRAFWGNVLEIFAKGVSSSDFMENMYFFSIT